MQYTIEVENVKCGGCASTIQKKITEEHSVNRVDVNIESGVVTITSDEDLHEPIREHLKSLGYPEKGSVEGLENVKAKATSFVSCAIGRVDNALNDKKENC